MSSLSQRIEFGLAPRQTHGAVEIARSLERGGVAAGGVEEALAEPVATLIHPLVLESHEQLFAIQLERGLHFPCVEQALDLADVDPDPVGARQRDRVARGLEDARGLRPEGRAQPHECGPQAHPCALVEDVRPEARGDRLARVRTALEREHREEQPRAPARRRAELAAVQLEP